MKIYSLSKYLLVDHCNSDNSLDAGNSHSKNIRKAQEVLKSLLFEVLSRARQEALTYVRVFKWPVRAASSSSLEFIHFYLFSSISF